MSGAVSLLIIAYLFLGGAGAGAFFALACADVRNAMANRGFRSESQLDPFPKTKAARTMLRSRGYAASFALLLLGSFCLLVDLGHPEQAYFIFSHPAPSFIALGAYALAAASLCTLVLFIIDPAVKTRPAKIARAVALGAGLPASAVVMLYTGALLESMNAVPLWNTPLLIALFLLSALSTGIAVVLACSVGLNLQSDKATLRSLAKADAALIALELAVSVLYLFAASQTDLGAQSVARLLTGDYSTAFVGGYYVLGLLAPGALNIRSAFRAGRDELNLAIACLVLVGGFLLRLSIVGAGIHSGI